MTHTTKPSWLFPVAAILAAVLSNRPADGSPESLALVRQGARALDEADAAEALRAFEQAATADPQDAQAVFLQGVALSRLRRFQQANSLLLRGEKMGAKNPALDLEIGWSLVGMEDYAQAIPRLERYEGAHPGGANTSFLLGRALLATGRLDEAETRLGEAITRDARIEPAARAYLAVAAEQRGDVAAGEGHLGLLLDPTAGDEVSRAAQRLSHEYDSLFLSAAQFDTARDGRPWGAFVTMGGGYNSNVSLTPDSFLLPVPTGRESGYGLLSLGGHLKLLDNDRQYLAVGYTFGTEMYDSILNFANTGEHEWFAAYAHALGNGLVATLRVNDQYTLIDSDSFRNRYDVQPGLLYRPTEDLALTCYYGYARDDFFRTFSPPTDRDGENHQVLVAAEYHDRCTGATFQGGYYHIFSNTAGSDFDYDSDSLFVAALKELPCRWIGQIRYMHGWVNFENPNSFTGFAFARDDQVDLLSAMATRPIALPLAPYASVFFRVDYWNDHSNVPFYNYDQFVVGGGVTLEY